MNLNLKQIKELLEVEERVAKEVLDIMEKSNFDFSEASMGEFQEEVAHCYRDLLLSKISNLVGCDMHTASEVYFQLQLNGVNIFKPNSEEFEKSVKGIYLNLLVEREKNNGV